MRSLIARISGGLDLDVVDLNLSFVLDEVGEFDVIVPARSLNYRTVRGSEISIISNGNVLVSGFVEKSPDLPIKRGETLLVKLSCLSELGRLTCHKALADSHFQDTQIAVILATLLATVPDWTLQTVNMPDPTIATTIDLRGCETLFCQIVQTVQSVPELHLRFGGFSGGIYTLAVGAFNNLLHSATQDHNLVDLTLQANSQRCYNIVESYGALSRTQNVTLADSLLDARTIASPYYTRYPIILLPDGSFGVEDTLATCECAVRKSFSLTKTENDADPTPAEIAEAGYALYLKTVRYLQSREDYDSFRGTVIYETPPNIGDRCHLKANVLEPIWDEHNQCITYHPTFSVNTDYRVTKLTFAFERGVIPDIGSCNLTEEQFVWDIELTSSDEAESFDPDSEITNVFGGTYDPGHTATVIYAHALRKTIYLNAGQYVAMQNIYGSDTEDDGEWAQGHSQNWLGMIFRGI